MGCSESKERELTVEQIVEGLKAALDLAARETVKQLNQPGGFSNDPALRIKTPGTLGEVFEKVRSLPGIGSKVDEFELKLNEAAEAACGAALEIVTSAINGLNFQDARAILQGADNAATRYFREVTGASLLEKFTPIVRAKMQEVGVISLFETITDAYASIPLIGKKINFDIYDHVVKATFEGFFTRFEQNEARVRHTPEMYRTNKALEQVFGRQQQQQQQR
jgi:hypothetical protein